MPETPSATTARPSCIKTCTACWVVRDPAHTTQKQYAWHLMAPPSLVYLSSLLLLRSVVAYQQPKYWCHIFRNLLHEYVTVMKMWVSILCVCGSLEWDTSAPQNVTRESRVTRTVGAAKQQCTTDNCPFVLSAALTLEARHEHNQRTCVHVVHTTRVPDCIWLDLMQTTIKYIFAHSYGLT